MATIKLKRFLYYTFHFEKRTNEKKKLIISTHKRNTFGHLFQNGAKAWSSLNKRVLTKKNIKKLKVFKNS